MTLMNELYLGVIIGLCWSLKSMLSNLPGNKVQFIFCGLILYYLLGGFSGKLKLIIGLITYALSHQSDRLVEYIWTPLYGYLQGLANYLVMLATMAEGVAGAGQALPSPPAGGGWAGNILPRI